MDLATYREPNRRIHHWINVASYQYWRRVRRSMPSRCEVDRIRSPIWVCGLFRSGTTVTTKILETLGVDLGPSRHRLKALGLRAQLNPQGFLENHLFMDLSLFVFKTLGRWGDDPPSAQQVRTVDLEALDRAEFSRFSIVDIHDDRISNRDKVHLHRSYGPSNLPQYLAREFSEPLAVKNPHFAVLPELLERYWPRSRFLVVFRWPADALRAATKVTPRVTEELYRQYYCRLLEARSSRVVFFSLDELLLDPQGSVASLADALDLPRWRQKEIDTLVQRSAVERNGSVPGALRDIYAELRRRAINVPESDG